MMQKLKANTYFMKVNIIAVNYMYRLPTQTRQQTLSTRLTRNTGREREKKEEKHYCYINHYQSFTLSNILRPIDLLLQHLCSMSKSIQLTSTFGGNTYDCWTYIYLRW